MAPLGDSVSGVDDVARHVEPMSIMPNPVNSGARLDVSGGVLRSGAVDIDIVDPIGRIVRTTTGDAIESREVGAVVSIETRGLSAGVYLVRLRQSGLSAGTCAIVVI